MVQTVEAEVFYMEAGRRRTLHRGVMVDGVAHVATERCNLDDAAFQPRRVEVEVLVDGPHVDGKLAHLCGWCFPQERAGSDGR